MDVDASAVARVVGITTEFKDLRAGGVLFLPQRIALFAQGSTSATYSTDKFQITSAFQAGSRYGFGSPIHLAARELFPLNGDGVGTIPVTVYPMEDAYDAVAATGTITPTGTQTSQKAYRVKVNEILSDAFTLAVDATVADACDEITAAINATLEMPITATDNDTDVGVTAKWAGESGNDIYIEIVGEEAGITFAVSQPSGGLINPDVDTELAKVGDVWESMALNALNVDDTDTLDKYQTWGEGRWGTLVRKPLIVFSGNTDTTVADAIVESDSRKDDRVNAQLVAPGSKSLPFVVAARQLARIAKVANNNPPRDYGSQRATGLTPGDDGDQWDYTQRDQAVKAGSSTIKVDDGVVKVSDVVTFYHPQGDPLPAYRYVVDVVKVQNIIFNVDLLFNNEEWDGAPLIPDDQPTVNRDAKKPKMAKAEVNAMIDSLGLNAIVSDPESAKAQTTANINAQNPKRLDIALTVPISGNANIISIDLNFGFFFGSQAAA